MGKISIVGGWELEKKHGTFVTKLLNSFCLPGNTSKGTSTTLAEIEYVAPASSSGGSTRALREGSQSSGRTRAKACEGKGEGRGGSGGAGGRWLSESFLWCLCVVVPCSNNLSSPGTSPSNIRTSGNIFDTSKPTLMPLGRTIFPSTIPLARKLLPKGLIFISLIVTSLSTCGLGFGAGNSTSISSSCWRSGLETKSAFGWPAR